MEEETFIDEYFKNPDNVAADVWCENRKVKPAEFYQMGETSQADCFVIMKKITCKDGFKMSVQACYSHYCNPRITIRSTHTNYYDTYEVGYPSEKEELLMPYAEDKEDPTQTVYGQVPKDIINKIIEKHNH